MSCLIDFEKAQMLDNGWMLILPKNIPYARQFVEGMQPNRTYTAEFKQYRERRSNNANAYMWTLCEKLAKALHMSKNEVYRNAIREVGVYKDFHDLAPDAAKTLRTAWGMLGDGWHTEQVDYEPDGTHVHVRAYYGSSRYNTKQMSRLIDYIVQDCKAVGIETLTPMELARLKEGWKPNE